MGRQYGWVAEGEAVPQWKTDRDIHLTGRVISAVAGSITVSIVFAILLQITGVLGALLGAVLLLIAPGHVVHSRFQTTDVLATMFVALALYFLLRLVQADASHRTRFAVWSGVAVGLAAGTKYSGILLLVPIIGFLLLLRRDFKNFAAAIGATIVAFLIATPGLLLETGTFWNGFLYEMSHVAEGHGIVFANTPSGFLYHLDNLKEAFGLTPLLLGFAGLIWAATTRKPWVFAVLGFAVLYYILIGRAEVKFLRYVFPLLPVFAIGAGYLGGEAHRRQGWYRGLTAFVFIVAGFSLASKYGAVQMTAFMRGEDPRDQAARWILKNRDGGTVGLVSDPWFYTPPLFADTGRLDPMKRLEAMASVPWLIRYMPVEGQRKDWDTRLLTEERPDRIVFSSFEFLDNDRINQPDFVAFIEMMTKEYEPEAVFWGPSPAVPSREDAERIATRDMLRDLISSRYPITHDMMYIQPTICLFKKRAAN